jgi:MFS family permease
MTNASHCVLSSFAHSSLGHRHDIYIDGEDLPGPCHVRDLVIPLHLLLMLCSARLFLGLAEGGLFPGLIYYISTWYPRRMQAKRIAILPASGCVGAAVGGILAYCIEHLDG